MGRYASIDPLGFHNFAVAQDSIKCKYDDSKADKDGEKLSEKKYMLILLIYVDSGGLRWAYIVH